MFQSENYLNVAGQIIDSPVVSHTTHEFTFMCFTLKVSRLSGAHDNITVLIDSNLLSRADVKVSDYVEIVGELRSYNNKSGVGSKLMITAYAKSIKAIYADNKNELHLRGTICKMPVYRRTPLGREICDLMIAINRKYGRADYLPCIAWGKNAQLVSTMSLGDNVEIFGRIQSREYIKTIEDESFVRTTYEVSISQIDLL